MRIGLAVMMIGGCKPGGTAIPTPDVNTLDVFGIPEAPLPGFRVERFEPISVVGTSEPMVFTVGDDTTTVYPVVQSAGNRRVALTYAEDPNGQVWVDLDSSPGDPITTAVSGGFPGLFESPNRTLAQRKRVSAMLPNTPRLTMIPGDWIFEFGAFDNDAMGASDDLDVAIVERTDPVSDTNELDLDLHFTGVAGITAATAPDDPNVRRMLDRTETIFAAMGVTLGDIGYYDVSGDTVIGLEAPACTLGRPAYNLLNDLDPGGIRAVNVVFVDRFDCPNNPISPFLIGLTGGLPGIPASMTDGVFMGTSQMETQPEAWANVAAHELAHFLGLYHTSELVGDLHDQLDDTPESLANATNLMFPSAEQVEVITDDQAWVLRRSLFLQPN